MTAILYRADGQYALSIEVPRWLPHLRISKWTLGDMKDPFQSPTRFERLDVEFSLQTIESAGSKTAIYREV